MPIRLKHYIVILKYFIVFSIFIHCHETKGQEYFIDSVLNYRIEKLKRDTSQNLVLNFSFENYSICPDGCSVIPKSYFVDNWMMATLGTPDYYNICSYKSGVPNNWVGKLYAKTGFGYTGLIPGMYINSNQNLEEKREYIESELKKELKKDEYYFLGFSTSLAGASQYAINGIGLYLSDTLVDINNSIYHLPFKPQLLNKDNVVITEKYKWKDVYGIYKAQGGERYILLGNFQSDEDTRVIDTEKPGNLNCSYYLFDDIYVIPLGRDDKLEANTIKPCISIPGKQCVIHFEFDKSNLSSLSKFTLDSIVKLKEIYPNMKLEISGFTDNIGDEAYNQKLSERRAKAVFDYLIAQSKLLNNTQKRGFGEKYPVSDNGSENGRALNRRVEIRIK